MNADEKQPICVHLRSSVFVYVGEPPALRTSVASIFLVIDAGGPLGAGRGSDEKIATTVFGSVLVVTGLSLLAQPRLRGGIRA